MSIQDDKRVLEEFGHLRLYELVLGREIRPGRTMISPLRGERNASFNVFRDRKGRYLWKDFAFEGGDIFALSMILWGCSFKEALERLLAMAGGARAQFSTYAVKPKIIRPRQPATIITEEREWSTMDQSYWGAYGISLALLVEYGVRPLDKVILPKEDRKVALFNRTENPIYGIFIDDRVKIYRPLHPDKSYKSFGNVGTDQVFGLAQAKALGPLENLMISAGQKDALAWTAMGKDFPAIAFPSESSSVSQTMMLDLLAMAKQVHICYDNDATGRKYQQKLIRKYPMLKPLWLGEHSRANDIADIARDDTATLINLKSLSQHAGHT